MQHQITLPITGMHCEGCAATITRDLNEMEGILTADVSIATEQAAITFNPDMLSETVIVDRIRYLVHIALTLSTRIWKPLPAPKNSEDSGCNSASGCFLHSRYFCSVWAET